MNDMSETTKMFGVVALVTLVIIGGILLAAKNQPSSSSTSITGTLPAVTDSDWSRGNKTAPNTLVEYADFQCPACAYIEPIFEKINTEHGDKVRQVFRHFPLSQHANELPMAYASEAAGIQGKFWEMHDLIYAKQSEWSNSTDTQSIINGYAQSLNLDTTKFTNDLTSDTVINRVNQGRQESTDMNLPGTPAFFLNGKSIQQPATYEDWLKLLGIN